MTGRFPVPSETFIFERFVRLIDRGWDMHIFCTESHRDDQALFPAFSRRPELLERIHTRPRRPRREVALAVLPFVLLWTFARFPGATVRYMVAGWRVIGTKIVRAFYYDRSLIGLGPDLIHFTFGWFAPGRAYLGPALGAKLAVSFQGADVNYGGLEEDPGYYDDVWRSSTAIHFLSHDLRRRAISRGYIPDGGDRDVVILPGTDLERFAPAVRERSASEPLRMLSVGRLHWKKGYDYALQAVRILRDGDVDLRYRIIGDGPDREAVVYAIHDLRLQDVVTLVGAVDATRVRDEMQWADVFLHASTSEGFCYAAVEAQAMRLPVVTSDADGLPENVADGETGFVVPRRNADRLAEAVAKLHHDPDLRTRFGGAGRDRVARLFQVEREIDEFEAFYRDAIGA